MNVLQTVQLIVSLVTLVGVIFGAGKIYGQQKEQSRNVNEKLTNIKDEFAGHKEEFKEHKDADLRNQQKLQAQIYDLGIVIAAIPTSTANKTAQKLKDLKDEAS